MRAAPRVASVHSVIRRELGCTEYDKTFRAMKAFTETRRPDTPDEIWQLEHFPVYTMGLRGRAGTRHEIEGIPLTYTDRGGDVTYHGPGQVVQYLLLDLTRLRMGPKRLVTILEDSVIELLAEYHIEATRRAGAPGVYTAKGKIAALGLRLKHGCCYHGLSLNVHMDLGPFRHIDPCGYPGQPVTQLADFGITVDRRTIGNALMAKLVRVLGYTE